MKPLEKNDGFNFINYILLHLCNCLKKRDVALGGFINTSWWYIYKVNLKNLCPGELTTCTAHSKNKCRRRNPEISLLFEKTELLFLLLPPSACQRLQRERQREEEQWNSLGRKRSSRRCLHAVLILLRNRVWFSIAAVKQHHFHPPHAKFPEEPSSTRKSSVLFKD